MKKIQYEMKNHASKAIVIAGCVASLFLCGNAKAAIVNPGFEAGPVGWTALGFASINTTIPYAGLNAAQLDAGAVGAAAVEGFLGLGAGSIAALSGPPVTSGSALKQSVTAAGPGTLSFHWRFIAADYLPFDDFGFYSLYSINSGVLLSKVSIVGDFGDSGWMYATVPVTAAGTYTLGFGVFNVIDDLNSSRLYIDDVSLVAVPEPTTYLAGALLAIPFGAQGIRYLRNRKQAA